MTNISNSSSHPNNTASITSLSALAWLAFFIADIRDGLGPFLATYLQEQQVDQHMIGIVMTAGGLATVVMTLVAGAWADRTTAKRLLLAVAMMVVLVASYIAFSSKQYALLIGSQVATGVAGAMMAALMASLTLSIARQDGLKKQTGKNEAWSHAGNLVSAIASGLAAHFLGAPWILAVMTAMAVGMLFSLYRIKEQDIDHRVARGDYEDEKSTNQKALDTKVGFADLLKHRALLLFGLTCTFFHLGNGAMLPLLNQRIAATIPDSAPLLWTSISIVVAQIAMIPVALWTSRSRKISLELFIYMAILLLPIRGLIAWFFQTEWGNVPVQILDGIAGGILGVATPLLVEKYVRGTGNYNTALGVVLTMQGVGGALSPTIANFIVGSEGKFGLAFMTLAGISLLALPTFYISQKSSHLKGRE